VLPSGEVRSAGAGAEPLARLLPGGKPLGWLFKAFPGLTERSYRFVADRRDRFAGLVGVDASCQLRR
jgi:predicted DCC family thiol-disulfide oxidoreductase YuxK